VGPKALMSPIAMGMRAAQIHKAGTLELRPATRIQRPKPTMMAEIAYAAAFSTFDPTANQDRLYDSLLGQNVPVRVDGASPRGPTLL
jgi:hypothetical protein